MLRAVSAHDYYEQQYVLRKTLPSFASHVAEWEALSADEHFAGCSVQVESFGDHPRQSLELFKASDDEPGKGLAVFIHGGFWRAMNREQSRFMAKPFLQLGFDCAVTEYRLMPHVRMADLVSDTLAGLRHLIDNADRLKITAPTVIAGHSAGAHLALYSAIAARETDVPLGDAPLVLLSGVYDAYPIAPTSVGGEFQMTPDEIARYSIHSGASLGGRKAVFVVGGEETQGFQQQSLFAAQQLCPKGEDEVLVVEGANHLTLLTEFARSPALRDAILARVGL